jgi:hypothetical protein
MRLDERDRRDLVGAGALKRLLVGTVLATLLLGAQDGGKPWHAACWVIVGAILATLTEAYGTHLSTHRDDRVRDYLKGLGRSIVYESIFVVAALPTVLFLVLAATFHWPRRPPKPQWQLVCRLHDGRPQHERGVAVHPGDCRGSPRRLRSAVDLLFGVFNACLGLAIVNVDLELR